MSNSIQALKVDSAVRKSLIEKVTLFKGRKVLVIGDVGVDEYIMGAVKRISPEAPVPVLEVEEEDKRLGLAANVAQNVVSMGGDVKLLSVVGIDDGAEILKNLLHQSDVSHEYLISDKQRPTTRKTRVMTGQHHLVRVDHEVRRQISASSEQQLLASVEKNVQTVDVVVLEDYAKGLLSQQLVEKIVGLCHQYGKTVMVDPHQTKFADFYKGVDLIKPNYNEALALTGVHEDSIEDQQERVLHVGRALQKMTGAKQVVLTQGKDGMTIFSQNDVTRVPTFAKKVFDVTGAGDTVIAALALGVAAGLPLSEACMIANFAAGVVVGKVGCVPCTEQELVNSINTLGQ
ncbi:D-glycero-beta-D-manno-heptose-7-phosphate kinase [Pseudobdellovibrio exovorus]|uniref:ADP-heptose synthase n=1 Tax=Pseudobdellovibrio exovorus JSS TaxID=1184267 RepID=M4VP41_9BACT|nr:D-glycero-beta-D-manno-heptose-7-phosphate kinase [Pseudobdellovibrio exovorus]AGH94899.1 ADP-heptose synthase [Pseudobdellovibrio exovorus JSS]